MILIRFCVLSVYVSVVWSRGYSYICVHMRAKIRGLLPPPPTLLLPIVFEQIELGFIRKK